MMLSIFTRLAVVLGQQIDQQSALVAGQTRAKRDLARNTIQIMDEQDGIVAPVIANSENRRIANRQHLEIAPANLGEFLTPAGASVGPVKGGILIAPLIPDG